MARPRRPDGYNSYKSIELIGLQELKSSLENLSRREATNLLNATLGTLGTGLKNKIKRRTPKDTGKLKKSIRLERRRELHGKIRVEIRGEFYWRFNEYGTIKTKAQPFVNPSILEFNQELPNQMREQFGKKLEKLAERKLKKA